MSKFWILLFGIFALLALQVSLQTSVLLSWLGFISLLLSLYRWKTLYVFVKTFPRDIAFLKAVVHMKRMEKKLTKACQTPGDILSHTAKKYPNKPAIVSADTGRKLTFKECDLLANKVGNYFFKQGFQFGDAVGIWMENELEYLPIALGLSKVGIISALINVKLNGDSLRHVLKAGKCKALIYHVSLKERLVTMNDMKYFQFDNSHYKSCKMFPGFEDIPDNSPSTPDGLTPDAVCFHLYTSGSTGCPKATPYHNSRYIRALSFFSHFSRCSDDVSYNVIPMYHGGGIYILFAFTLINGSTMVIRRKFQPQLFFEDCCRHGVTICGFIGEMCRYLLKQPESEYDQSHKLRIIMGNGLRGPLISHFKERFNIPTHYEYYGATEANTAFTNMGLKEGTVGFTLNCAPRFSLVVKVNEATGEIVRNSQGHAIECPGGTAGLLVNKITPYTPYEGYVDDEEATKKNVEENLFEDGDRYFVTGDIFRHDDEGWLYFVDRMADNYKWGGENVSISQIENVISQLYSFSDVICYSVRIPQGKVGMVFVNIPVKDFDIKRLSQHIQANLPSFSHPQFVRVGSKFNLTGTFKYQKNDLKANGYNPANLRESEKLYFHHNKMYEELNEENYVKIASGDIIFANER